MLTDLPPHGPFSASTSHPRRHPEPAALPIVSYELLVDRHGIERDIIVSPEVEVLTGYSVEEYGRDPSFFYEKLLHPADRVVARRQLAAPDHRVEYRIVTKCGRVRPVLDVSRPMSITSRGDQRWIGLAIARCSCLGSGFEVTETQVSASSRSGHLAMLISEASNLKGLSSTELRLFTTLAFLPDRVWTFSELEQAVWGSTHRTDTGFVRTAVHRLRKRLAAERPELQVASVRNLGYRLTMR